MNIVLAGTGLAFACSLLLFALLTSIPNTTRTLDVIQRAQAAQPEDFRFAAVGDWGCNSNTDSVVSVMAAKNPEVILGLGDYSYSTTMTCWHDRLTTFPTAIHDKVHLYNSLAFGNHEDDACANCGSTSHLDSAGEAEYLAHFGQPPTFFSFDHKRAHFIAMDTQSAPFGLSSPQYAFVRDDLIQTKQRIDADTLDWVVVFMHHPLYTSCIQSCDPAHGNKTAIRDIYQPLFDTYGVDVVLQGHVHGYERMKPMKYNAEIQHPDSFDYVNPAGQVYLTVGTGGQSMYQYTSQEKMSAAQIEDFGFLQVDITRTSLIGRFVDKANAVRDSFVIAKIPDQTPPPINNEPPPSLYHYLPSYYFNGNNYTETSSTALKLTKFSVATWFKLDADYSQFTQKRLIANKGGFGSENAGLNMNYGIWVDFGSTNGNKIEAGFETSSGPDIFIRSPAAYRDGQWHYAALTYDGSNLRLYIDGNEVAKKATTALPDTAGNQPFRVGMNSQSIDRPYIGYADEIRVWNRALSATEVSDQFNQGTFNTSGQVAYLTP